MEASGPSADIATSTLFYDDEGAQFDYHCLSTLSNFQINSQTMQQSACSAEVSMHTVPRDITHSCHLNFKF